MSVKTERRKMRSSEALLMDVIMRQAGTLDKAILEGVMNGIDAKASKIDVNIDNRSVIIADNGVGFKTQKQIKRVFEVFGAKHELDEDGHSKTAKFGRFRMGRGQIMAFGKNMWLSGRYEMRTDIKNNGLEYELIVNDKESVVAGCQIYVDLYDSLSSWDIENTKREVLKLVRYVETEVYINGELINTPSSECDWDYEDDFMFYAKVAGDSDYRHRNGLNIYHQGVYIETLQASQFGMQGDVNVKGPMTLNFARNQIIRSSSEWDKLSARLVDYSKANLLDPAKKLTLDETASAIERLASGALLCHEVTDVCIWRDTNGRSFSAKTLATLSDKKNSPVYLDPAGKFPIGFDEPGSRVADVLMQNKKVLVLDKRILGWSSMEPEQILDLIYRSGHPAINAGGLWSTVLHYVEDLDEAVGDDASYEVIPSAKLTWKQTAVIGVLSRAVNSIVWHKDTPSIFSKSRNVVLGRSARALAWTDGKTYIAFDSAYVAKQPLHTWAGWFELLNTLAHEMAHGSADTDTHNHTPEFYEEYHELMCADFGKIVQRALNEYRKMNLSRNKPMAKMMESVITQEAKDHIMKDLLRAPQDKH